LDCCLLDHQSQQVIINNCLSNSIHIISGVPQSSVLGQTLFLLYINDSTDAFKNLNCVVKLYADDAQLCSSFKLGDYCTVLVNKIEHLVEWSKILQLRIASSNECIAPRVSTINTLAGCDYAIDGYTIYSGQTVLETLTLVCV